MDLGEYQRYGRQMIIPQFGKPAQLKLKGGSVIVIGAGGLGCPALQYLAAAGVGRIGIVDHDVVDSSNLQRQILHTEATVGRLKAESAAIAIQSLNSTIKVDVFPVACTPQNAEEILAPFEVVIDCTDNIAARYLLSDVSVKLQKPLVSGAAQRLEGQLCTYNLDLGQSSQRGPCYRCLFPKPPSPETIGTCEETGILGTVTGVIGVLQALEAIKILAGLHSGSPSLLIYSALSTPPFRCVKLRKASAACTACGEGKPDALNISSTDYILFCGSTPDWLQRGLQKSAYRMSSKELYERLSQKLPTRILDVRQPVEFGICHLPTAINIPLNELVAEPSAHTNSAPDEMTVVVCRLGNDSQLAASALRDVRPDGGGEADTIVDLIGGLRSWSYDVDSKFPIY